MSNLEIKETYLYKSSEGIVTEIYTYQKTQFGQPKRKWQDYLT